MKLSDVEAHYLTCKIVEITHFRTEKLISRTGSIPFHKRRINVLIRSESSPQKTMTTNKIFNFFVALYFV